MSREGLFWASVTLAFLLALVVPAYQRVAWELAQERARANTLQVNLLSCTYNSAISVGQLPEPEHSGGSL